METTRQQLSSLAYQGDLRSHFRAQGISDTLDSIPRIVKDFERRFREFRFTPVIDKTNPVVLDLGSGDSPHFYKMMDYFGPDFTYIGVELKNPKDVIAFLGTVAEKHPNFHPIMASVDDANLPGAIENLTDQQTVDVILVENFAVDGSDNIETDQLLEFIIHQLIPRLLDRNGMVHFEAASLRQADFIEGTLQEVPSLAFKQTGLNFTVVKNPELLQRLESKPVAEKKV